MKLWSVDNLKAKRWPSFSWEGYDEQSERPFRHIAKCKRKRVKEKYFSPSFFFFNDCSTFHNPSKGERPPQKNWLFFLQISITDAFQRFFFFSPSTTFRAFFCLNPRMQWRTQPPFICHQIKQLPLKQYFERKKKGKGGPSFFFFLFCCC